MTLAIEFLIEDETWRDTAPWFRERALRAAELTLAQAGLSPMNSEISVLLASDARLAELNAEFRDKTGPTNILSWPTDTATPAEAPHRPADGFLGDLALARETVESEAAAQHIPLEDHLSHLIAHGVLHLLGYDHQTDADAEAMEMLERRALAAMGIPDPYLDRSDR